MKNSNPAGSSDAGHGGAPRHPGLPRRRFLAGAGAAGAAAFAASAIGLGAPEALAATRTRAFRRSGAATGMPSLPEVWSWEEQLVRFGTRYTGSSGHAAYVDWLAEQLSAVPGFSMRTDRLTFNRWLARDFALRVKVPTTVGRSGPVPLTYYYGRRRAARRPAGPGTSAWTRPGCSWRRSQPRECRPR